MQLCRLPKHTDTHLANKKRRGFLKEERAWIVDEVKTIQGLIEEIGELNSIQFSPANKHPPYPIFKPSGKMV